MKHIMLDCSTLSEDDINLEVSLNLPFRKFPSIVHPVVFNHGWLFHEFIIILRVINQYRKVNIMLGQAFQLTTTKYLTIKGFS